MSSHSSPTAMTIAAVSCTLVLALFASTVSSMAAVWLNSATFAHGFLVLPISLYLIWTKRRQIVCLRPIPNLWMLPVLATLGFGWLMGKVADVQLVQHLALVAMLPALIWTIVGSQITRALLFPLAYLFFAAPVGESLTGPLQDFTALLVVKGVQLSGVPVLWEGRLITVPSGVWEIAKECSGLRYLISAVAIGCLYVHINYRSWSRRVTLLLVFVLIPILFNGVRAYSIVMLTHVGDRIYVAARLAGIIHEMYGHLIYGWLMFAVMMSLLFWIGQRWREDVLDEDAMLPLFEPQEQEGAGSGRKTILTAAVAVALLALAPIAVQIFFSNRAISAAGIQPPSPRVVSPWTPVPGFAQYWEPHFIGVDEQTKQAYRAGQDIVYLYRGYYLNQNQDGELIHDDNSLFDRQRWTLLSETRKDVLVDGQQVSILETRMRSSQGARLMWHWYWLDREVTSNTYYAKFLQAKARFVGGPQETAVIALVTDYQDGAEASSILQDFLNHASLIRDY
jgi:exosortase A